MRPALSVMQMIASAAMQTARAGCPAVANRPAVASFKPPMSRRLTTSVAAYTEQAGAAPRAFPKLAFYKGKGAVQFKIIPPTFSPTTSATGNTGYDVAKEGVVLAEFANVQQGQGAQTQFGNRSYAWDQKITFALSVMELGQICEYQGGGADNRGLQLVHDPNKGAAVQPAVKILKNLKITSNPDGSYFLSINQTIGQQQSSVSLPIARNEMWALRQLSEYAAPRLLGFDMLFEGAGTEPINMTPAGSE